jgi:hypothetical protein
MTSSYLCRRLRTIEEARRDIERKRKQAAGTAGECTVDDVTIGRYESGNSEPRTLPSKRNLVSIRDRHVRRNSD